MLVTGLRSPELMRPCEPDEPEVESYENRPREVTGVAPTISDTGSPPSGEKRSSDDHPVLSSNPLYARVSPTTNPISPVLQTSFDPAQCLESVMCKHYFWSFNDGRGPILSMTSFRRRPDCPVTNPRPRAGLALAGSRALHDDRSKYAAPPSVDRMGPSKEMGWTTRRRSACSG